MDQFYNWCIAHPLYCTIAGIVLSIILGMINLDKVKFIGFTLSQLIRKTLGKKVEQKVEDIVDAIDKGMHCDDEIKK
jgi:hypothetical protein